MGVLRRIKLFFMGLELDSLNDQIDGCVEFIAHKNSRVDCVDLARGELAQLREKKYKLIIEMSKL